MTMHFKTMGKAFPRPWTLTKGPTGSVWAENLSLFLFSRVSSENPGLWIFSLPASWPKLKKTKKKKKPMSLGRNDIHDKAYHISYASLDLSPWGNSSWSLPPAGLWAFLLCCQISWNQNCVCCLNCSPHFLALPVPLQHLPLWDLITSLFWFPWVLPCQAHQNPTVEIVHFCICNEKFACVEVESSTQ